MLPTHAPIYTDAELDYLRWYNNNVQYFFYAAVFGFLVILASLNGIYRILYARGPRSRKGGDESTNSPSRLFWLATLATYRKWTYRRSILLEFLGIQSAGQATVILGYSIITFSLAISGALGHIDYIAHHCARLCFAQIPLLVGLASRELGVIAWVTGLHSATLVALHRWIGRSAIVLAMVHVSGRLFTNAPRIDLTIGYQAWGLVGLILWLSMSILSIRAIRARFYKFFIFSHLSAFALSLIALSLHRPQVAPYLIAGAVIYSSDRIFRVLLVAYYALRSSRRGGAKATVEILSDDVIRVKTENKRRWKPVASSFLPITHVEGDEVPTEGTQSFIIRVHQGFTLKLKERALESQEKMIDEPTQESESSIELSPIFSEGPYGHNLRLHRFESVLLLVGGTGVTFAVGFLLDLVRRARVEQLYATQGKKLSTKRLTFVWSVRDKAEVEWIGDELREAIQYAPPGFLELQIYVTRMSAPLTTTTSCSSASLKRKEDQAVAIQPVSSSSRHSLESHRSSVASVASDHTPFGYLPTSPTDSMLPPIPLPEIYPSSSTLVDPPRSSIEIPLIPGRCRPRDTVERVVGNTSYSGSVAVLTCGPSKLTEEVARASSDIIDPSRVLKGESRLNVMLHVESYGW
ncbi:ferric reductase family protein [Sporobolomyces salmoneus]|uniref:ferric reductase family protein n=1 Tax=Sporobolomyces salmoneus TaxID=183962 RepID=UPI003179D20D